MHSPVRGEVTRPLDLHPSCASALVGDGVDFGIAVVVFNEALPAGDDVPCGEVSVDV